jgi:hypothetical protein
MFHTFVTLRDNLSIKDISFTLKFVSPSETSAGIFKQFMGARIRVGIGFVVPARQAT